MNGFQAWHAVVAVFAVAGAAAAGTALALTGAIGRPEVAVGYSVSAPAVDAVRCIDGPVATSLASGQRVFVVARNADSSWLGVRHPAATLETIWVPANVLTVDAGESLNPDLTIGGECPQVTVTVDSAAPPSGTAPPPGAGNTAPQPDADTTAPQLGGASATPSIVSCQVGETFPTTATVSVAATDNTAVTSVSISWTGRDTGQGAMSASGGTWTYSFDPADGGGVGDVTFRMVARDAAGNASAEAVASVYVDCLG